MRKQNLTWIISLFILALVLPSINSETAPIIGYNIYNGTLDIWNTQDHYFFNISSGIQLTNHYDDYWTHNIFCLGYYNTTDWVKIKCADELSTFNRSISTDNLTYVNATLWKDFTYSGYDFRFGIKYNLKTNDSNLSVIVYGKNMGGTTIPFELGFAWKIKDIEIPFRPLQDSVVINQTTYRLDGNYDLMLRNMTSKTVNITYYNETNTSSSQNIYEPLPYLRMSDTTQFLRLDWNPSLNYAVRFYSDGNQSNAYTMLMINAGTFTAGQEKSTTLQWIDAEMDYISSFSTSASGAGDVYGMCAANDKLYMGSFDDDKVYVFWQNGSYSGTSWAITADSRGIACNSSTLWVQDPTDTDDITEYLINGTPTGRSFFTAEVNNGLGLAFDGIYFYAGNEIGHEIFKYWANGSYTGTTWTPNNTMGGMTTYGNYLYTNFGWNTISSVKKTYKNITYVSAWNRQAENANYGAIAMNGSRIWIADVADNIVYVYEGAGEPAPSDIEYPQFSNYQDNNGTLIDSGTGQFNVTVTSTNGTVLLNINGSIIEATNLTASVYNASYVFSSGGVFTYNWTAYGNGTLHNQNISVNREYTVNKTIIILVNMSITYPQNITYSINISRLNYTFNITNPDSCWYSTDNGAINSSRAGVGVNFTNVPFTEGSNKWNVFCNDTSNNLGNASITFDINFSAVSSCQKLDIENQVYKMIINVSNSGSCFNVSADNITLDCQGYSVGFSNAGRGINGHRVNSTTIRNCYIIDTVGDGSEGIFFNGVSENTTVYNNTFFTSGNSINIDESRNSNISKNRINVSGSLMNGIALIGSPYSIIDANYINITHGAKRGIYISGSSYFINVTNNYVYGDASTSIPQYGLFIWGFSSNILNNTIIMKGDAAVGISFDSNGGHYVANNYVLNNNNNGGTGFSIDGSANNVITNYTSIIYGDYNGYAAILVSGTGATNNSFSNLKLYNNGTGNLSIAYFTKSWAFQVGFGFGITFTVKDSIFNSTNEEFFISDTSGFGQFNFTNVTRADGSKFRTQWYSGTGTYNRNWYLQVNVSNLTSVISNATVLIKDNADNTLFNGLTDNTGFIPAQTLHEFLKNSTSEVYYTQTVNVSALNHRNESANVNLTLTLNTLIQFTLLSDLIPPNINIISPINFYNSTDKYLDINYLATDNEAISSCWYSNDSYAANITLTNCINITSVVWSEGQHNVTVWAEDTSSNINSSSVTFTIDSLQPVIIIYFPTNHTAYNYHNQTLNFSVSDAHPQACWKNLNGYGNVTISCFENTTVNSTGESTVEGANNLKLWANDSLGNIASEYIEFDIHTGSPAITLNTPTEGQMLINQTVNISFTPVDSAGLLQCDVYGNFNGSFSVNNTFMAPVSGVTISYSTIIGDGSYIWNVKCNDTFFNIGWHDSNHTFSIDSVIPNLNFVSPTETNGSYLNHKNIYVNVSAYDTNLKNLSISLYNSTSALINYTNTTSYISITYTNCSQEFTNSSAVNDGYCGLNYNGGYTFSSGWNDPQNIIDGDWDNFGNGNLNATNNLSIEYIKPTGATSALWQIKTNADFINLTIPDNCFNYNLNNLSLIAQYSCLGGGLCSDYIKFYCLNSGGYSLIFSSGSGGGLLYEELIIWNGTYKRLNLEANFSVASDGVYYFNATAFDSFGNQNNTETRQVTIDTTYPLISYGTGILEDYANVSANYIYVNTSWIETNFQNITFNLYNSSLAIINSSVFSVPKYDIDFLSLTEGVYYFNAVITDKANHANSTALRKVTLDITAPTAQQGTTSLTNVFVPLVNNTFFNNHTQNFTANVTDNSGIKNVTIVIETTNGTSLTPITREYSGGILQALFGVPLTLIDGVYTFFIKAYDLAGNFIITPILTFFIDTTPPIFESQNTTNIYYFPYNESQSYFVNATINELYPTQQGIEFNGVNHSINNIAPSIFEFNFTKPLDSVPLTMPFYWWMVDNATNSNHSKTYYFNLQCPDNWKLFNDSLCMDKLLFNSGETKSKTFLISNGTTLTNAKISFSGYNSSMSGNYCFQETATVSTACGGLNTGNYWCDGTFSAPCSSFYDEIYAAGAYCTGGNCKFYTNITIPFNANQTGNIWRVNTGGGFTYYLELPAQCIDSFGTLQLRVNVSAVTKPNSFYCRNATDWVFLYREATGNYAFREEAVNWSLNSLNYLNNVSLTIGTAKVWNYSGIFNQTNNQTLNFAKTINSYLSGCTFIGGYCYVPLNIASETAGLLQITQFQYNSDGFVENILTFNPMTIEGTSESFAINILFDTGKYTIKNAYLYYNNTQYVGIQSGAGNNIIFSKTINVPLVSSDINKSFYWTIGLTNSTGDFYFNSSQNQQQIINLDFDDCLNFTNLIYNISLYEEDGKNFINPVLNNSEIDVALTLSPLGDFNPVLNKSGNYTNKNPAQICINTNLSLVKYRVDMIISYIVNGYVQEFHYIDNGTLSNSSNPNIYLYDLASGRSTSFLVTYQDENYLYVPNVIVDLWRKYIPSDNYISVEHGKTDTGGQTRLHLVTEDVIYKALVWQNGQLVYTTDDFLALCQATPCQINLRKPYGENASISVTDNIAYSLEYNDTEKKITFTFATDDGTSVLMNMSVTKMDNNGNVTICDDSAATSGGTLTCIVPTTYGNVTFLAEIYKDNKFLGYKPITINPLANAVFGNTGIILTFLTFLTLALMGITSGIAVIVFGIIGLIFASLLMIFEGGNIIGLGSGILFLVCAGIIIIYKISKGRFG